MVCENADGTSGWAFTDGTNSCYVKGFCAATAINLSGNTVLMGETCSDATSCLDAFPFKDYFDDLDRHERHIGSVTWYRRAFFLDHYIPTVDDCTGPGNTNPGKPKAPQIGVRL